MFEIWHKNINDDDATQKAYNQMHDQQSLLQRDSFYLWFIDLLKPVPGKNILDISCGLGRLVTLAEKKGLKPIGVDFAIEGVRYGQTHSAGLGWLVGNGEQLPFAARSIDYITHIGSLEHYIHPASGAEEIARILKPDGKACILLPNAFGAWGNIKYVVQHGEIFDDGQPLQRYATRNTWQKLLCEAGLKIDRVIGYNEVEFPRTAHDWAWMAKRPQKVLRGLMQTVIPINLSNHFIFICSRD